VIERFNTNVLVFNSKLNELKQLLNEKQYVYLQGVSGSGKSTLAAHYAKLKQKEDI
jgi:ABC-type lipoprotein export system ATPase subunit